MTDINKFIIGKKYHITNQYYNSSNEWILDRIEPDKTYVFKLRQMEFYITKINDFEFEEIKND